MKDKVFMDTNLIIYLYTKDYNKDLKKIFDVLIDNEAIISFQVLKEFSNALYKKHKYNWDIIENSLNEIIETFICKDYSIQELKRAYQISAKYKYSFYDSLIIASALENNCSILYSEDMKHLQVIEETLTIINPFKK